MREFRCDCSRIEMLQFSLRIAKVLNKMFYFKRSMMMSSLVHRTTSVYRKQACSPQKIPASQGRVAGSEQCRGKSPIASCTDLRMGGEIGQAQSPRKTSLLPISLTCLLKAWEQLEMTAIVLISWPSLLKRSPIINGSMHGFLKSTTLTLKWEISISHVSFVCTC